MALREAGLPAQAIARAEARAARQPGLPRGAVQLGLTYWSLGRSEQAIAEWRRVLEAEPERDDARMYLRLVGAGRDES